MATESVSASVFGARCLNILNRYARPAKPAGLTRLGRAVAMLRPPNRHAEAVRNIHGFMRDRVIVAEDFDLTAPVLDPAHAEDAEGHG